MALDLAGFGLIWLGFWSIIAFRARIALPGGPREAPRIVEAPSEILPELQKLQKVIKCIIEHEIDHLAS